MRVMKRLLLAIILGCLLVSVPLTLAADEAPVAEETTATAPGIGVFVFLLGAGGIIAVGGMTLARDSFKPDEEA